MGLELTSALDSLLGNLDVNARHALSWVVEQFGVECGPHLLSAFEQLLQDPEPDVRKHAAEVVGYKYAVLPTEALFRMGPALVQLLRDPDSQHLALGAIIWTRRPSDIPGFNAALQDLLREEYTQDLVCNIIRNMPIKVATRNVRIESATPDSLSAFCSLLNSPDLLQSPDPLVRRGVIRAMLHARSTVDIPEVLAELFGEGEDVFASDWNREYWEWHWAEPAHRAGLRYFRSGKNWVARSVTDLARISR